MMQQKLPDLRNIKQHRWLFAALYGSDNFCSNFVVTCRKHVESKGIVTLLTLMDTEQFWCHCNLLQPQVKINCFPMCHIHL